MPMYNAELFLAEAIESVLNQTFTNFEFLIIDDGSSDNSVAIAKSYDDPRIQLYLNGDNIGLTATLNKGIELANADFIARMDADDICHPERLEQQYQFIKEHPDGILFACWAEEITEDKQHVKTDCFNPDAYYYNLTFSCWTYHPTLVYNKLAVKSVGMYTAQSAEDYELVWQLTRRYKFYVLPQVLLQYRIIKQSLSHGSKKHENIVALFQQIRRNIEYYFGDEIVMIEDWQIMQLGTNAPAQECNINRLLSCVKLLDLTTKRILQKENINLVSKQVCAAAKEKRKNLLLKFYVSLGAFKGSILLIKAGEYFLLKQLLLRKLGYKF